MKLSIILTLLLSSTTLFAANVLSSQEGWDGCSGEGTYPWKTQGCNTSNSKAADACCDSTYEPSKANSHKAACKVGTGENAYVIDKPADQPCSDAGGKMICVLTDDKGSSCQKRGEASRVSASMN